MAKEKHTIQLFQRAERLETKYFFSYGAISLSLLKLQYSYLPILKTLFLKISNKIDAFMSQN